MDKLEEVRINAIFVELQRQNSQAQSACGQLAGEIAVLRHQLEEAQSKIKALEERPAAPPDVTSGSRAAPKQCL